jgi:DHA2 family methylenomycin A resistance protein-like MFS transporter
MTGQNTTTRAGVLGMATLCLGYFMVILDTTVVNVALPQLGARMGGGVSGLQWVVDGYALAFAGLLLSSGALADRFGGRSVLATGMALFTAASAACGAAPNLTVLILGRLVQGVGAALLVPSSLALLQDTHPDAAGRARAIGVWGGVAGIAAAAGPVLGGVLTSTVGWRAVFAVNVPFGLLGLVLAVRVLPVGTSRPARSADLAGQVAGIVAITALTGALIESGRSGWTSPLVLGGLAVFVAAAVVFLRIEHVVGAPMLPLGLFDNRTFSAATAIGAMLNFGFYGQLFVITLYFQQQRGFSALLTGLALLPSLGTTVVASTLAGRFTARVGPRPVIVAGLVLASVGLAGWTVLGPQIPYPVLALLMIATGFGCSVTMPAATVAIMAAAPPGHGGIASGVLNTSRQCGGALGVAVLGVLVAGRSDLAPGLTVGLGIAGAVLLAGALLALTAVGERSAHQAR